MTANRMAKPIIFRKARVVMSGRLVEPGINGFGGEEEGGRDCSASHGVRGLGPALPVVDGLTAGPYSDSQFGNRQPHSLPCSGQVGK